MHAYVLSICTYTHTHHFDINSSFALAAFAVCCVVLLLLCARVCVDIRASRASRASDSGSRLAHTHAYIKCVQRVRECVLLLLLLLLSVAAAR